ncbi:MAG: MBL fold metallo-hydrolase [Candidatus Alcyoniella australis]|nr:MBL fold metallo-hydrolase [Candidatus Alcyoniella australis]
MIVETIVAGFLETNTYLVGDLVSKRAVVIDPAGKVELILSKAREHDLNVEWIVNTHGHVDHIRRNLELQEATGAKIAVHRLDAPLLNKSRWYMLPLAGRTRLSPPPDLLLDDGDMLKVGGLSFRVIHTPGHSAGSMCLKHAKALFCGDLIFAGAFGRAEDMRVLFNSIHERIFVLSDDIKLYPGHGPKTTIEAERKGNPFMRLPPEALERMLYSKRHIAKLERKRALEKQGEQS